MSHRRNRFARRAFTLLEVIVAVIIVTILAALVVPNVLGRIGDSKQRIAKAEANSLANQIRLYMADHSMSDLDVDFTLRMLLEGERPYLNDEGDILDPWDNEYQILMPGPNNQPWIIASYGKDRQPGGDGEAADIYSGK